VDTHECCTYDMLICWNQERKREGKLSAKAESRLLEIDFKFDAMIASHHRQTMAASRGESHTRADSMTLASLKMKRKKTENMRDHTEDRLRTYANLNIMSIMHVRTCINTCRHNHTCEHD